MLSCLGWDVSKLRAVALWVAMCEPAPSAPYIQSSPVYSTQVVLSHIPALWFLTPKAIEFVILKLLRSDQSLSRVRLFVTPCIAARQASLSITNSWKSLRLTSIESVMPSSHLILCRPLLLLPPPPPSIRVFSNESTLRMRWPKYWSFRF